MKTSYFILTDPQSHGNAREVDEAVLCLSLLDKHFFHAGSQEERVNTWLHQWVEDATGDRIHLVEMLDRQVAWLEVMTGEASDAETIKNEMSIILPLDDAQTLTARARMQLGDADTVLALGLGFAAGDPVAIELLDTALASEDINVRRAVGEAAVIRKPHELATMLHAAASREADLNQANAFRFAASLCEEAE